MLSPVGGPTVRIRLPPAKSQERTCLVVHICTDGELPFSAARNSHYCPPMAISAIGNRMFESISLRYYKGFMLAITIYYLNRIWANPQVDPQQFCRCRWTSLDHLGRSRYSPPVVNTSAHRTHCLSSM